MLRTFRYSATALTILCLAGCSAQKTTAPVSMVKPPHRPFSLDTPVAVIAADQNGKAVLVRDLPKLMSSRSYMLFEDMSLSQIASVSNGQLTSAKLDIVEADLAQLSN